MSKPHSPADRKPLDIHTRRKILDAHCIPTTYYKGVLFAVEGGEIHGEKYVKLIDTTYWSKQDCYDWLGY